MPGSEASCWPTVIAAEQSKGKSMCEYILISSLGAYTQIVAASQTAEKEEG